MSFLHTLDEGSSRNVVRLFFPRSRVVCSIVRVRVYTCSGLGHRLGMWLDIFKDCEVASSGAFLTSFDSFDPFRSRNLQALVIG